MAITRKLPNPPLQDQFILNGKMSNAWLRWFHRIKDILGTEAGLIWNLIDFTGSNITDIETRNHNDLQNIQGGSATERYHLTSAQHTDVTGFSTEAASFFSTTDITGAEAETLTNGSNADALHSHTIEDAFDEDNILLTADDGLITDGSGNIVIGDP